MLLAENKKKYQNFLSENVQFLLVKFSVYFNRHVFVMAGRMHHAGSVFFFFFFVCLFCFVFVLLLFYF